MPRNVNGSVYQIQNGKQKQKVVESLKCSISTRRGEQRRGSLFGIGMRGVHLFSLFTNFIEIEFTQWRVSLGVKPSPSNT